MDTKKQDLINNMLPKVVLEAITQKAKQSLTARLYKDDIIALFTFPFKIGRETRTLEQNGKIIPKERNHFNTKQKNNDFYLFDNEKYLQISREHCAISKENDIYTFWDKNSACGSLVNDTKVGKDFDCVSCELCDGDIITIGSNQSQYQFRFIILDFTV